MKVWKRHGKKALLFTANKYLKSKNARLNHFPSNAVTRNLFAIPLSNAAQLFNQGYMSGVFMLCIPISFIIIIHRSAFTFLFYC